MSEIAHSTATPPAWTESAYSRFWVRMGDMFGKRWYEQFGPEPTGIWKLSLTELPLAKVAVVLEHFRVSGDSFPPTLSQFMAVARKTRLNHDEPKALPKPPPTPEVVQTAINSMRNPKRKIRSVFNPDESLVDYQSALAASGMKRADFEAKRLAENGWTPENEASYTQAGYVFRFS